MSGAEMETPDHRTISICSIVGASFQKENCPQLKASSGDLASSQQLPKPIQIRNNVPFKIARPLCCPKAECRSLGDGRGASRHGDWTGSSRRTSLAAEGHADRGQ